MIMYQYSLSINYNKCTKLMQDVMGKTVYKRVDIWELRTVYSIFFSSKI